MEYQVTPIDYYVKEYFLAKSLIYVLPYMYDDILFEVSIYEAQKKYRTNEQDIRMHIEAIKKLSMGEKNDISESGAKLL